ncbi:MAG: 5-methylcytosine-specific restriction endonuclease system specificity protein McrC [Arcticibacter sp.]
MSIPIQNIYYLLCYAWDRLDKKDVVLVGKDEFTSIQDLLAKILITGVSSILKKGLDRDYVDVTDDLATIKGKLDFSGSIKQNLFARQRAICSFDEFSSDTLHNQILLSSMELLLRTTGVAAVLKLQLRNLIPHFMNVSSVALRPKLFDKIQIHRNNRHYDFPLRVCQLIVDNSIPSETPGLYKFMSFERDERKMNRLFEQFVRNFYKREQSEFKVTAEHISWKLCSDNILDMGYVPNMRTDITLKNRHRKIIIDTKYYNRTLRTYYDKETLNSDNLYQMTSYLVNQQSDENITKSVTGILLYPQTNQELNLNYHFLGHSLQIRTINLAEDWARIDRRLREIVKSEI